jgi:hypothetical protein
MKTFLRSLLACSLLASLLFWGNVSRAEGPTAADKETARGLMDRGDELTEKGDRAGALVAYQGAYAVVRVPTTGAAVARTLLLLGRFAEAKRVAEEVNAIPVAPSEPDAFVSARAETQKISADAGAKVAKLRVTIQGSGSATVTLDGQKISSEQLSRELDVDPGEHVVVATAPGMRGEVRATLAAGETKTLTLKLVSEKPAERTPAAQPATGSKTLGFVIGGIGVVGLATAGVTGAMLLSRDQKIKDNCPNKECNREGRELIDGNKSLFAINAVAWGVGVVGVGVGVYLIVSSEKSGERAPTTTAVGPALLPGGAGLRLGRTF